MNLKSKKKNKST